MSDASALVVENAPSDPVGRLGDWLSAAGLAVRTVRPHAGDPMPTTLDDHAALVVLGGPQAAYADPAGIGAEASDIQWFDAERRLLRRAVSDRVPTLAICLGAQLLAQSYGARVARGSGGPEIGARLVARRDVAGSDPLFAPVPFTPDVIQWHHDEIVDLPPGATLLASSPRYEHQAFRLGARAWGLQFHIECDAGTVRDWARNYAGVLTEAGHDPDAVADAAVAALDDVAEVWRPFAERFAALALGRLDLDASQDPLRRLPLSGE